MNILKTLKDKYPDKEYPAALGKKWTDEEEEELLKELSQNIDKKEIAKNHDRTIGGINARIVCIAKKMYMENVPLTEISSKTKLTQFQILEFTKEIGKEKTSKRGPKSKVSNLESQMDTEKTFEIEKEILEIKQQIQNINQNIHKIFTLLETFEAT